MKWEHLVMFFSWGGVTVEQHVQQMQNKLDQLGADGWEVAGVSSLEELGHTVILKRRSN